MYDLCCVVLCCVLAGKTVYSYSFSLSLVYKSVVC